MKKLLLSIGALAAVAAPVAAVVACGADKAPTTAGTKNSTGAVVNPKGPATVNTNAGDQTPSNTLVDASIITDTAIDNRVDQTIITEKATTQGVRELDIQSTLTSDELKNIFGTDIDKGIAADETVLGIKIPASFDRSTITEVNNKVTNVNWNQDTFKLTIVQGEDAANGMPDVSLPYLKTIFNVIPASAPAKPTGVQTIAKQPGSTVGAQPTPALSATSKAKLIDDGGFSTDMLKAPGWVPTSSDDLKIEAVIQKLKEHISEGKLFSAVPQNLIEELGLIDNTFPAIDNDIVQKYMINEYFNKVMNTEDATAVRTIVDAYGYQDATSNAIIQYLFANPDAL